MLPAAAEPDAAAEPPAAVLALAAGGWDAAVLELVEGLAPVLHADAMIATTANGPASRRNGCFVVKGLSSGPG
jgi:hypothetical protein